MKQSLAILLLLASPLLAQGPKPGATDNSGVTRIVAAIKPVTDSAGNLWTPDIGPPQLYNLGTLATCPGTAPPAANAPTPPGTAIYKSARIGTSTAPMTYTFNGLAAGNFQVTLYFDECYWTAAGQRVFNIQINNTTVFTNVDIFKAVGKNTAYVLTAPAAAPSGTMVISFIPITGKNVPIIDAIQLALVHTAKLTWTDGVNPAGSVAYNIYRSTGPCNTPSFAKIASNVPGFTYTDATIAPQTGYCYQITAITTAPPIIESLPCNAAYVPGSISTCNCQ